MVRRHLRSKLRLGGVLLGAPLWLAGCPHGPHARSGHADPAHSHADPAQSAHAAHAPLAQGDEPVALQRVAAVHGGTGPWAVAGYRMGEYALARLGLARGSFDIEVTHHTPRQVQYSCIADGAAAATGASAGKLNLNLVEAPPDGVQTHYRKRSTGQALSLRLTPAFRERFSHVSNAELAAAGRQVLQLPDREIFEIVP